MDIAKSLHMNAGTGDSSYANNSIIQQKAILNTWSITEEAINDFYNRKLPKTICIADLGCSSGKNTLFLASEIIKSLDKKRRSLGHESPEYQIYLNDLPSNDFNNIFQYLPSFQENLREELGSGFCQCFVAGIPGSFYGRLFLSKSLQFVHSSSSLMWLSQVPQGLEENKSDIYISSASPPSVLRAYLYQFQKDFSSFLKCRADELVANGAMVLSVVGRKSDNPRSKEATLMAECISRALKDLVSEGLIEEEKLYSFNIPHYMPSLSELKSLVEEEGSFLINRLEIFEVDSEFCSIDDLKNAAYKSAMTMRAVYEPLLAKHFGEGIIDKLFTMLAEIIISDCLSKEMDVTVYVSIAVTRRD